MIRVNQGRDGDGVEISHVLLDALLDPGEQTSLAVAL